MKSKPLLSRDRNIEKSFTKEISLGTKSIQSKKHYSRKEKHRKKQFSLVPGM